MVSYFGYPFTSASTSIFPLDKQGTRIIGCREQRPIGTEIALGRQKVAKALMGHSINLQSYSGSSGSSGKRGNHNLKLSLFLSLVRFKRDVLVLLLPRTKTQTRQSDCLFVCKHGEYVHSPDPTYHQGLVTFSLSSVFPFNSQPWILNFSGRLSNINSSLNIPGYQCHPLSTVQLHNQIKLYLNFISCTHYNIFLSYARHFTLFLTSISVSYTRAKTAG